MVDGWDFARSELRTLPRAVNFISGPSRTADIEQTLVLGAHGPYRVHIILIG
jgi:L-lactate dehydrogenase complex protein LldG